MDDPLVVVLTGAGRGLGHAMTAQFVERGHTVFACTRSSASVAKLSQQFGAPHQFRQVDVSDDGQVGRWAEELLHDMHAPDLLVNNAALINSPAPLWEVDAADFSELVDVNVKGVFHVIRHFLPQMIDRGTGIVVNFSSGWGRSTSPDVAPYCASKWAIEGLTRALADELPDGLAAVPLNPGVIATDMLRTCFGENASAYPTPTQWAARAVPFLLNLTTRESGRPLTVPS
jgi:NAD(P)-dependent dehydrogenase (short-subunit alcohol dehydrogenase family)